MGTVPKITEPMSAYIMVSDANAPVPVFETEDNVGEKLDGDDNDSYPLQQIFMYNDISVFSDLINLPLPVDINTKINNLIGLGTSDLDQQNNIAKFWNNYHYYADTTEQMVNSDVDLNTWRWNIGLLLVANIQWLIKNSPDVNWKKYPEIENIFGLENPYRKNTIVVAVREQSINDYIEALEDYHKNVNEKATEET
jgi:hypothetical protein